MDSKLEQALAGKLTLAEFEAVAMDNWQSGYFAIDPLAKYLGMPTEIVLSERGVARARFIRARAQAAE